MSLLDDYSTPFNPSLGDLRWTMGRMATAPFFMWLRGWGNFLLNGKVSGLGMVAAGIAGELPGDEEAGAAEGAAEAGPRLTKWGWTGGAKYEDAVDELQKPGTHENLQGIVPTKAEARQMIQKGGGSVLREEAGHAPSGVSTHTYPHINYTTASGLKATVRTVD